MAKCLECRKECRDDTQLHRHLKAHRMSQGNYYTKHFPRYDKLDGTPLIFQNREHYFESDFNSRSNMKDWLNQVSSDEAKEYVRGLLLRRKAKKNLLYTMTQVELRSLQIPGMVYLNRLFGDYYAEAKALGFKNKYDKVGFNGKWKQFNESHRVIVDTREQLPLSFVNLKTIHTEKLDFGDYKLNDDQFTHNCVIERKSLGDLYSTLTNRILNFRAELERARAAKFNLIVLVEEPFENFWKLSRRLKRVDVVISPDYILHLVRSFTQEFPEIQFLFVADREEASEVIERLFLSDGQFKEIDLQYAYDTGTLI
jgi:hypothetical protein